MTRPDRIGKKTVQAFVTVEKWNQLRHIVVETQRTADSNPETSISGPPRSHLYCHAHALSCRLGNRGSKYLMNILGEDAEQMLW
jgi:hypothetical protein